MSERCIANECLSGTGFSYTLSLINGKYGTATSGSFHGVRPMRQERAPPQE